MCMYIPKEEKPLKPKVAVRKFPYQLNKIYTAGGNFSEIYYSAYYYYHINGGGFHSFVEVEDVFESYKCYESTDEEKMVIVKCHIPKGSLYYIGESLGGEPNYVSQSIVIDKIIHGN